MIAVVLISRRCNVNPDNVATPIAASLGDLTTLALLAGISSILWHAIGKSTPGRSKMRQLKNDVVLALLSAQNIYCNRSSL